MTVVILGEPSLWQRWRHSGERINMFHPQKCSTNLTAVLHFAGSIHESLRNTKPNILGVMSRFQPELIYICVARLSASVTEQLYVKNRTWLILCRPGQIIVHWSCENVRKRYGRNSITRMSLWTSLLPPFKRHQCGIVEVMRLQRAQTLCLLIIVNGKTNFLSVLQLLMSFIFRHMNLCCIDYIVLPCNIFHYHDSKIKLYKYSCIISKNKNTLMIWLIKMIESTKLSHDCWRT